MKLKLLLLGLCAGLSLLVTAFIVARVKPLSQASGQGFTLYMTITDYPADGSAPIIDANQVRYHRADGSWKFVTTYRNGRVDVGYGQMGRGVFAVDEQKKQLNFLSGLSPRDVSEEKLRNSPWFVGEETILGFKTLHSRMVSEESGQVMDDYICPALQGFPLKTAVTSRNGAKNVHEVTQVIMGDPPRSACQIIRLTPNTSSRFMENSPSEAAILQTPKAGDLLRPFALAHPLPQGGTERMVHPAGLELSHQMRL